MDHDERNTAQRHRIERIVTGTSDDDLGRPLGDGWTVAVALAHIAFWDRITQARWKAVLSGEPVGATSFPRDGIHWTNEAAMPQWRALPARTAAEDALRAADELDRLIAGLPAWAIEQGKAIRPGMLDRTGHRGQHLDRIEEVLDRPRGRS